MERRSGGANLVPKVEAGPWGLFPRGDRPEWLLRGYRAFVAFAGVLGCYWLYWLLVVPLVESPSGEHHTQGISAQEVAQAEERFQQYRSRLLPLFPEGTWHLSKTKIIETEDVIVLLANYERPDELHLRIWPCAGVISAVTEEDGQTIRSAIIIEAPNGAILEFDAPVDLRRGQIRRPVRIEIQGLVRLRQYIRGAKQEELLSVETRSVQVDEKCITTTEEVRFRFGPHFGKGRGLKLVLRQPPKTPSTEPPANPPIAIEHVVISRVERLHLAFPSRKKNPTKPNTEAEPPLVLELACDGPFRFEPEKLRATFDENVRAWRPGPGATDELRCEELILWLAGEEEPADSAANSPIPNPPGENPSLGNDPLGELSRANTENTPETFPPRDAPVSTSLETLNEAVGSEAFARWQIRRVQMRGGPAIVRAPLWQFAFEGNFLDYDLTTGQYFLGGEGRTVVRYGGVHIQAANLRGHLPFDSLGTGWEAAEAELAGPGSLSHTLREDLPPPIIAQWQHRLLIRPHEGRQLLSLLHGAKVTWEGVGNLSANELHLWLLPPPGQETAENFPKGLDPLESLAKPREPRSSSPPVEAFVHIGGLQPERLLAKGNVVIDFPQAHVTAGELRVIFDFEVGNGPKAVMRAFPRGSECWSSFQPPQSWHLLGPGSCGGDSYPPGNWSRLFTGNRQELAGLVFCSTPANTPASVPEESIPAPEGTGSGQSPPAQPPPTAPESPPQGAKVPQVGRFDIAASLLQIRLRPGVQGVACGEAYLEGNVQLSETLAPEQVAAGIRPALVTGDSVHLADPGSPYWSVLVLGRPGHLEGRSLSLTGPRIVVNAASNRLWLDQGGRMAVWIRSEQFGRTPPSVQIPLVLRWGQSLVFDGQVARFEGGVQAEIDQAALETRDLEVILATPIRFSGFSHPAEVQLQEIRCQGPTTLRRNGREPPEDQPPPPPSELLEVADLAVAWQTGQIWGRGPGRLIVRSPPQTLPGGDLTPKELSRFPEPLLGPNASASAGQDPATGRPTSPGGSLLVLRFARSLEGNLWQRRLTIAGHVRGLYFTEWPWSWVPEPDSGTAPPPGAFRVSCGKITAIELALPGMPASWELAAEENVWFEGQSFTGKAPRVTYAQGKDLLVLEGTSRTPAELYRQERPGEKPVAHTATRLLFWPGSKKVVVEGLHTLQVP